MTIYTPIHTAMKNAQKLLAILIDPDKFELNSAFAKAYLQKIPSATTHIFIGGSTDPEQKTKSVVRFLKAETKLPLILFPGDYKQVTSQADAILFLSLLSGDNAEFLIGQQTKAALMVQQSKLEVIPTGYLLIDGGSETAVQRVSKTTPLAQNDISKIIATALAGQYLGKKCIYLEAGSGAKKPVHPSIIAAVYDALDIPIIVGGGIKSIKQMEQAYQAGATMVVIGTAFEEDSWSD